MVPTISEATNNTNIKLTLNRANNDTNTESITGEANNNIDIEIHVGGLDKVINYTDIKLYMSELDGANKIAEKNPKV